MNKLKSFFRFFTITDYSLFALCGLYSLYYQNADPKIKFIKGEYIPFSVVAFKMPHDSIYARIHSYKFKFKNKSVKAGAISRVEILRDRIDVSQIEIYSAWINKVTIGAFSENDIQVDIVIKSNDDNVFLRHRDNRFKLYFYDDENNLIKFNGSNARAVQELSFNNEAIEKVHRETKKSLYDPYPGSGVYPKREASKDRKPTFHY
jgi:hypothetical protein